MKKFLYTFIVFLITALLVQYTAFITFKYVLDKKSKFRISRYFRSPKHKYFVIGNSRGVNSIDEKYAKEDLKTDIVNLSFNGMPFNNALDLINQVNQDNVNSTILFEISCIAENGFDGAYAYYSSNSEIFSGRYRNSIYKWPTLLRLNNEFFLRNIYYLKNSDDGWVNMNTISPAIINSINRDTSFKMFPKIEEYKQRLSELQKICTGRGNRLIYFLAPYYPTYLTKASDYNIVLNYMAQNRNTYQFIDLNKIRLSTNMFADRVHTNINGAKHLTYYLLENVANAK